jgi:hypothetical protein
MHSLEEFPDWRVLFFFCFFFFCVALLSRVTRPQRGPLRPGRFVGCWWVGQTGCTASSGPILHHFLWIYCMGMAYTRHSIFVSVEDSEWESTLSSLSVSVSVSGQDTTCRSREIRTPVCAREDSDVDVDVDLDFLFKVFVIYDLLLLPFF